jgi:CRISP-associated protein Cas1
MIKKTLYFENPSYVHLADKQLVVKQKIAGMENERSIPVEDIGLVILDHPQITTTQGIIAALLKNNACIVYCDEKHMPSSFMLPLADNDTYSEKVKHQIAASEPLKKQLWKQTVSQKILNQSRVLAILGFDNKYLLRLYQKVVSGDQENLEGHASAVYWELLLKKFEVRRGRYEESPNHYFNYGYAILRSVIARNLVGSGCLPVLGIHHTNKYNPYCLADDIMEPYRPIVDLWIYRYLLEQGTIISDELSREDKKHLLHIPVLDIVIEKKKSPLMVGAQRTTASLVKCYMGESRKLLYPEIKLK